MFVCLFFVFLLSVIEIKRNQFFWRKTHIFPNVLFLCKKEWATEAAHHKHLNNTKNLNSFQSNVT